MRNERRPSSAGTEAARPAAGLRALLTWGKRHTTGLAVAATAALHVMGLSTRLSPDEGGFAMVARYWRSGGSLLYGSQWVDRPPGLITVFAVADELGPLGVRVMATLVAVGLVLTVSDAARSLGGPGAERWSAWIAFAFASSWLLDSQRLDGELVAATLVALSMAATLRAIHPDRRSWASYALLAGASAVLAVLTKQNFVDGIAFCAVLLVGLARQGHARSGKRHLRNVAAVWTLGAGTPLVLAAAWASGRPGGVSGLVYAMYGFRADAAAVLAGSSRTASLDRLGGLALHAWSAGMLPLLLALCIASLPLARRRTPHVLAMLAAVAVEGVGVLAGGSYWGHYLIALVPTLSIGAGLLGARSRTWACRPWIRGLLVLPVLMTTVTSPVIAASRHDAGDAATTGQWVARSSAPGDTILVTFTHANVIQASGLRPAYPYSWSLPVRVRDPRLQQLQRLLRSPQAPTWVVQFDPPTAWHLDPHERVDTLLRRRYVRLPDVCGHPVWLLGGRHRKPVPVPAIDRCRPGSS